MIAESQNQLYHARYTRMYERTQSFVDLAEARAVVIAPVQTAIRVC